MSGGIKIGTIWGIPVKLHISWFLIFAAVTWSLAVGYLPGEYRSLPPLTHWLLAAVTSLLFFASVLGHEFGHVFVALRNRVPVKGVTLFIFGGVAELQAEPGTPGSEFRIAIAGPIVSVLLAGLFGALWLFDRRVAIVAAPSLWLGQINLLLGLLNLIPGFPLDGGRVLRAIVWKTTGNFYRATRIASISGQLVAFGFMGWGIYSTFRYGLFAGLWYVLIGWFLQNAAASTFEYYNVQNALRGVRVGQVMSRDLLSVPTSLTVRQLVEDYVLARGRRNFIVTDGFGPRGIVALGDLKNYPRDHWDTTTVSQVMTPWERVAHVAPTTELMSALQAMDTGNVAQLPVVDGLSLVGLISREDVLRQIRLRAELGYGLTPTAI